MKQNHQTAEPARRLTADDVKLMEEVRDHEVRTAALVARIQTAVRDDGRPNEASRQAAIARTEFEGAFMRLNRAVMRTPSPWSAA